MWSKRTTYILNNIIGIKCQYIWEYKKHLNIKDKPEGLLLLKNKEYIRVRDIKPDILIWRNPIVGIGYKSIKYLNLNLLGSGQDPIYLDNFPSLKVGIFQNGEFLIYGDSILHIKSLYFNHSYVHNKFKILNVKELRFKNCLIMNNVNLKVNAKRFYSKDTKISFNV